MTLIDCWTVACVRNRFFWNQLFCDLSKLLNSVDGKPKVYSTHFANFSFSTQVFSQLGSVLKNCDISIHLVEVSQKLSEIQALTLTDEKVPLEQSAGSPVYMKGVTKSGIPISWYRDLQDVPKGNGFTLINERILITTPESSDR